MQRSVPSCYYLTYNLTVMWINEKFDSEKFQDRIQRP
jgi:hypothetical protein